MLVDKSLSIFSTTSLKQHMEYFNFRSEIQSGLPVMICAAWVLILLRDGRVVCVQRRPMHGLLYRDRDREPDGYSRHCVNCRRAAQTFLLLR